MNVGVMRISDACRSFCNDVIPPFSKFFDKICFLNDNVTDPIVLKAMSDCPNVVANKILGYQWDHGRSFEDAFYLGKLHGGDWIGIVDHDDILPYKQLASEIAIAESREAHVMTFLFLHCYGDINTAVHMSQNEMGEHGKMFRKEIEPFKKDQFCLPQGYHATPKVYYSRYMMRHLMNMTQDILEHRKRNGLHIANWVKNPILVPFNEDLNITEWIHMPLPPKHPTEH